MKELLKSFLGLLVLVVLISLVYKWGWTNAVHSAQLISTNETKQSYVIGFGNGKGDSNISYHEYEGNWEN